MEKHSDLRGDLLVAEIDGLIPFVTRRIFTVHNVPRSAIRGGHAHKTLHEFLMVICGQVTVDVFDGENRSSFLVDAGQAIYLPPLVWASQRNFSIGSVMVVAASHTYDTEDYIHDMNEFLEILRGGQGTE